MLLLFSPSYFIALYFRLLTMLYFTLIALAVIVALGTYLHFILEPVLCKTLWLDSFLSFLDSYVF